MPRLFTRRTVYLPTPLGWLLVALLLATPAAAWWFEGESYLAVTDRGPEEVLIVEGWIGAEGLRAAKAEFESGHYRYAVTTGGFAEYRAGEHKWNFAYDSRRRMIQMGFPPDLVIDAPAEDSPNNRTFLAALALRRTLAAHRLHPAHATVFTRGVHARRSRLVYAKVLAPETEVGVIAWIPSEERNGPWWKSSERAQELLKESFAWVFEACFNSGRLTNHPA